MGRKEAAVENYLREQVALHGGLCEKHVSPGRRNVPDELVTWFEMMDLVETKAPDGELLKGQVRDHQRRRMRGIHVWVLHTKERVDAYIKFREPHWI